MNLRLEMLQVARLAPNLLGDSASLVEKFIRSEQNSDGGFKDRAGQSDLYYTVFGLDSLLALQAEIPGDSVAGFLDQAGTGENLDFIHLCCLARCWGTLQHATPIRCAPEIREALMERLILFRSRDGGFNLLPRQATGSVYASFLAAGAFGDLAAQVPEPITLIQSLKRLETSDGAWANDLHGKTGSTPSLHRGTEWLVGKIECGEWQQPSPIGFYFAKLWYYERLYPLIFSVAALGKAIKVNMDEEKLSEFRPLGA